jgi:hypothetical protein
MYKSSLHFYRAVILFSKDTIQVSSVQQLIVAVEEIIVPFKEILTFEVLKKIHIIIFKICDSTGHTFNMTEFLKNRKQMAQHGTTKPYPSMRKAFKQYDILFLAYFPYIESRLIKSHCCLCVYVSPLSLQCNGLVNTFLWQ